MHSFENRGALILYSMIAMALPLARAQTHVGANYGSRDPKPCSQVKDKSLTAGQAREIFICGREKEMGTTLYLVEDVKLQLGSARKWQTSDTYNDIDPNAPVYPIRAAFTEYACRKLNAANGGRNCSVLVQPQEEGICYKTSFGEWSCKTRLGSGLHWDSARTGLPPPR